MKRKGAQAQSPSKTKIQISASLDPEKAERIERLALVGNKSRALVMAELIGTGLPILERQKQALSEEEPEG